MTSRPTRLGSYLRHRQCRDTIGAVTETGRVRAQSGRGRHVSARPPGWTDGTGSKVNQPSLHSIIRMNLHSLHASVVSGDGLDRVSYGRAGPGGREDEGEGRGDEEMCRCVAPIRFTLLFPPGFARSPPKHDWGKPDTSAESALRRVTCSLQPRTRRLCRGRRGSKLSPPRATARPRLTNLIPDPAAPTSTSGP